MATDHKTLGDQPAIPHHQVEESETFTRTYAQHKGVSKRELAAFLALAGTLAANDDLNATDAAQRAIDAAEALLSLMAGGAA